MQNLKENGENHTPAIKQNGPVKIREDIRNTLRDIIYKNSMVSLLNNITNCFLTKRENVKSVIVTNQNSNDDLLLTIVTLPKK